MKIQMFFLAYYILYNHHGIPALELKCINDNTRVTDR